MYKKSLHTSQVMLDALNMAIYGHIQTKNMCHLTPISIHFFVFNGFEVTRCSYNFRFHKYTKGHPRFFKKNSTIISEENGELLMMKIFVATVLIFTISIAISQSEPNPCGEPGNQCNSACISENNTDPKNSDKKGYCGTSLTSASTATTGCLCPNGEKADDKAINTICIEAVEQCRMACGNDKDKDDQADCASPSSSETDSQCVCSGGY
ncbi:MAG: hypothetical protein CL816_00090 [Coxiellaceae bacterium]|nr:hypothetical protein [Coxiellaceae bacterium]